MSDARPSKPARRAGVRLGDVPVLALLAAAAIGYAVVESRSPAPVDVVAPGPAPLPTPPPRADAAPVEEVPAAAPVVEAAPAPPPPATAEVPPEPSPDPVAEPNAEAAPEPSAPPIAAEALLEGLRAALAGMRCAELRAEVLDGVLSVSGTVTSADDRNQVQRLVESLPAALARPAEIAVASHALCEPLLLLEPLRNANTARGFPLTVQAVAGGGVLTGGQDLVLDLRAADGAGYVQVDYFTVDGGVVHLLPNPLEPAARLEAGGVRRLGERGGRTRFWTIGPPFGQELIVVIASDAPLFAAPRPEAEPAAGYLAELKRALAGPAAEGALAAASFIATRAP